MPPLRNRCPPIWGGGARGGHVEVCNLCITLSHSRFVPGREMSSSSGTEETESEPEEDKALEALRRRYLAQGQALSTSKYLLGTVIHYQKCIIEY